MTSDPAGSCVEDAACRPPQASDCRSGPQTPLGDAQRPAAQVHPQQTGHATARQGIPPPNPSSPTFGLFPEAEDHWCSS